MRIVRNKRKIRHLTSLARRQGKRVGFIPTMGALHHGHAALIQAARRETDLVVVSIFVNPIQFNEARDFQRYPRNLRKDAALCARAGCDLLFVPSAASLYPPSFQTHVSVDRLSRPWEGRYRPGHFRGVATVVTKLFNLVQPTVAFFGQKDAQQARIVGRLIEDLNFDIRLRVMPTVREKSGLATSSRNARLSSDERRRASLLFQSLQEGSRLIQCGLRKTDLVVRRIKGILKRDPKIRIEYVAVVDPRTLEKVTEVRSDVMILAAIRMGRVRLIDERTVRRKK